jgi:cell division protein FtsQ
MAADPRVAARLRTVRKERRHRRTVRLAVAATPVLLVVGGVLSPVLDVDEVRVSGNKQLSTAAVLEIADVRPGSRMVGVDTAAVARRFDSTPVVRSVEVRRSWPGMVEILVVERQPAIGVSLAGRVAVFDAEGIEIARGAQPKGVPMLRLASGGDAGPEVISAAVTVVRALPKEVRQHVMTLTASSVDDLTLTLRDGATVVWGSRERSAEKATVLAALLPRHARRYDVRSPDRPALS